MDCSLLRSHFQFDSGISQWEIVARSCKTDMESAEYNCVFDCIPPSFPKTTLSVETLFLLRASLVSDDRMSSPSFARLSSGKAAPILTV